MKETLEIDKDLSRWPRGKWLGCVLLLFALQLGGIYWASPSALGEQRREDPVPRVVIAEGQGAHSGGLVPIDPLIFAEAHPRGFSGPAWLFPERWNYSHDGLAREADFVSFAEGRKMLPPTETPLELNQIADAGFFTAGRTRADLLLDPEPPASRLSIEGPLANRKLAYFPELPPQQASDVIENSIVEIGVNSDGLVVSARLLNRTRSRKAAQDALDIARALRFQPGGETSGLTWGTLIFQWHAVGKE